MNELERAIESWAATRDNVLAEVRAMPDDQFDLKPHPDSRSFEELTLHIVASGLVFAGELSRDDGDWWRQELPAFYAEYADEVPETASKAEILELLQESWSRVRTRLEDAGAEHMKGEIRSIGGQPEPRIESLRFAAMHEYYHCGQLTVYLRLAGTVPALTRKFQAMMAGEGDGAGS